MDWTKTWLIEKMVKDGTRTEQFFGGNTAELEQELLKIEESGELVNRIFVETDWSGEVIEYPFERRTAKGG